MPKLTRYRIIYDPAASEEGQHFRIEGPDIDDLTFVRGVELAQFMESCLNAAIAAFCPRT